MKRIAGIMSRIRGSRKEDTLLSLAAVLLFLLAIGYTVFAVRSLARRTVAAFLGNVSPPSAQATFDFGALEPLIEAGKIRR